MNVTNVTNTTYTSQTDKQTSSLTSEDDESLYSPIHHTVKALDEKANEILDSLLAGMSKKEQTSRKVWLDFTLNAKVSSNGWSLTIDNNAGTSREAVIGKIDKQIANLKLPGQPDMLNLLPLLEELKKLYLDSNTPEIKNTEDSVINEFFKESISFSSSVTKEKLETRVKEFHLSLVEEFGNSPEAKNKISIMLNDYKKQLLEELKTDLTDENSKSASLEKQSIVKVLLDNKTTDSPLKDLLQ
jgi:hypothetical protein